MSFALLETTIAQVQAAYATGALTARELVELYLDRIAAYDQAGPALNAISVINEKALAAAEALDRERLTEGPRGPLHGIPVLVKDNYETVDMQTAAGSILLKGWLPPDDAFLVKQLRQAGAIIIAKTNMTEFAYGITSAGSLFGQVRNPYDPQRNPGGSSGGTGAGLAANFGLVGLGSDTCGSIRIPAAHNNLAGIRGTQGLLSRSGIIPLSHTQDIGGPLARTVADLALTLDALVGYDPDDPETALSLGHIPDSYSTTLDPDGLRGARIGLLVDLLEMEEGDEPVARLIRQATEAMRGLGAVVREVSIPEMAELLGDRLGGLLIIRHEFKHDLDAYLARRPTAPLRSFAELYASDQTHPAIAERVTQSAAFDTLDTVEYRDHLLKRGRLKQAIYQAMLENEVEVLVYPTIRRQAALIGQNQPGTNCMLSAASGLPALTVPAGFTADGLPVGLEMLGQAWAEPTLLAYGYAFEQATRHRRPPAGWG